MLDKQKKMCYNYLVRKNKERGAFMSDTNNKITKKEVYATIVKVFNGELTLEQVEKPMYDAILARMAKDIEVASKVGTKKETENDRLNKDIQNTIIATLTEKGTMAYADLVKEVQAVYEGVSAQKVTANVTKVKDLVNKFEDGKGKDKKLYIKLV